MRQSRLVLVLTSFTAILAGCRSHATTGEPSELSGQDEAIRQLNAMPGERIVFEVRDSGDIIATIPGNDGSGGGWNDHQFLTSVPYLERIPGLHTLRFVNTRVTDTGMSGLKELPQVREIYLHHNRLSDAGLEPMRMLEHLEHLTCDNTLPIKELQGSEAGLTGQGVEHLLALPQLQSLDFSGSPITDDGARAIAQLAQLRILKLSPAHLITDAGVADLATMSELEELQLTSQRITDAALESLAKMPRLKRLGIHGKQLSDSGLRKLRERLPETRVNAGAP